ncbi:unnamed protein product, partial [Ectocarpus sp. 12 AP-2014]
YVSTFVGGHFLPDIVSNTLNDGAPYSEEIYQQDMGFAARFAIGGRINERFRAEVELGFSRSNQGTIIDDPINDARTPYKGHGEIDTYTLMGNVWADLPVFENTWGLTPYVGGGIGVALVNTNMIYTDHPTYGPQDSSVELAAQLGAGVNWAINERFSAGLGYRFMFITGPDISQQAARSVPTYRFDDLLSHTVGVTLTMNLN